MKWAAIILIVIVTAMLIINIWIDTGWDRAAQVLLAVWFCSHIPDLWRGR